MIIKLYQVCVSPYIGMRCRFYPSCSEYVMEALKVHGFIKGAFKGGARLMKCHSFHSGGIDPVIPARRT
jgi:putative membrane protein insertion efficiency factor